MITTDAEIAGKRKLTIHQYLTGRRKAIEGSIAAEVLAGNTFKESCERTALAEITALECEIGRSGITLCRAVVGRVDNEPVVMNTPRYSPAPRAFFSVKETIAYLEEHLDLKLNIRNRNLKEAIQLINDDLCGLAATTARHRKDQG